MCDIVLERGRQCGEVEESLQYTNIYAPKLFNRVKRNNLLERVGPVALTLYCEGIMSATNLTTTASPIPSHATTLRQCRPTTHRCNQTYLAARGFGEPQSPLVHQRMLDGEVIGIMKDGDLLASILGLVLVLGKLASNRGKRELGERALLRFSSHLSWIPKNV